MQELSVAMIDDVEKIKFAGQPPRHPRIVPEAIDEAIRVEAFTVRVLSASEPAPHRRANPRRVNNGSMIVAQMVQQHLSHQIHAGPVLFHEVTDDGDAQSIHPAKETDLKSALFLPE